MRLQRAGLAILALRVLAASSGGAGSTPPAPPVVTPTSPGPVVSPQRISTDLFADAATQHATEVESSTVAFGSTVVSAFQVSRATTFGSADIGFATSPNGGLTWTYVTLAHLAKTVEPGRLFDTVSDPSVAFDAVDNMCLVAWLAGVIRRRG